MRRLGVRLLSLLLVLSLLAGCAGDAGQYIRQNYPLIDVQGQGKSTAKIYAVEGKDVPTVAQEIAASEPPQEISKSSADQMFLVYNDKIVNVQKDPNNEAATLVEVDTITYARDHYDSSFLEGYITATLLQSLFGGGWYTSHRGGYDYRGYRSTKRYEDYGRHQTVPYPNTRTPGTSPPATTDRKGSYTTPATPPATKSPGSSTDAVRRNDGSTPTYRTPAGGGTKPGTTKRSGTFKRRR
ncbi:DUF4247 domain-containing protein [Paenibacillus mucilaginosus]|uniref:Lipoprotein n=3 Tax=Paenibacillus mucilaginosus TaxID=61624 RepID=H6NJ54_9BACL|nr:DUF4247 domain-containing protein [Paenibacillus mucilaginosus]AEI40169.1 lipoprotein, putative [Paenibacillus mucilaginosus KNP414]AFC28816.1 lipoprotein [Paenibacillus mucilaginosus 3016]AFH60992.1 hypothetical protein B2K_09700 [Paenibacillus mucilaginosus K02]MCG7215771.1 DUF4247 domain-containing protein [Paenibacillus mucilaginosus]WDM29398.1 DUF4247 domain-containing protein [Paenibacillus mucilaginosus]